MSNTESSVPPTFAELLAALFELRRRPDGSRYSLRDVAAAMSSTVNQRTITHQYLSLLLKGKALPGYEVIEGLCLVFDVAPEYFFPRLQGRLHRPLPRQTLDQDQ
ncbi:MAG: helix-turn-helix transcriptional regulator [Chloroflexi bacterium]|nr:helix-turn-helix transcriptional regulator [Chloroflexota bacterium]